MLRGKSDLTTDLAKRRAVLKAQQQALLRGETPPVVAPDDPDPQSCTQDLRGIPGSQGYSLGSHPDPRNASGSQDNTWGRQRADCPADLAMPLTDYVWAAADKNRSALEYAETWQGVAFTFTRYLKGHPGLRHLDSRDAGDVVDRLLTEMFPDAADPWVELLGDADSAGGNCEPFDHFTHCWDIVKHPIEEAPLDQAVRLAAEHPVALPQYRSPRWEPYRRFVSISRWLQFAQDGENIFLPVRKFGELLGVSPMTVSNYRTRAEQDGYLVRVKEHVRHRATEYRFNLEALRSQGRSIEDAGDPWEEVP